MKLGLTDYIRRWRHTLGYGVHSPLAYRIVKECIKYDSRYGFYCDAYLDFEYHEDKRGLRRARIIIRILNLLRPSRVWIPGGDKRLVTALGISMPRMLVATQKECPKNVDFIIDFTGKDINRLWEKIDSFEECGMITFKASLDPENKPSLTIRGRDFSLFLKRKGMEKTSYDVL